MLLCDSICFKKFIHVLIYFDTEKHSGFGYSSFMYLGSYYNRLALFLLWALVFASPFAEAKEVFIDSESSSVCDTDTECNKTIGYTEQGEKEVDSDATPSVNSKLDKTMIEPISGEDPMLLRLRDDLRALTQGDIPLSIDIDALFNIRLDNPHNVSAELASLPEEIALLEERVRKATKAVSEVEESEPPIERSMELDTPPVAPVPPEVPTPPVKPAPGLRAKDLGGESPRAYYKRLLSEYDEKLAVYEQLQTDFLAAQETYNTQLQALTEKEMQFQTAVVARTERIKKAEALLRFEESSAKLRLEIARMRRNYLTATSLLLGRFPTPALTAFQSLNQKRAALHARSDALRSLRDAASALLDRIRILRDRTAAGALIGFQVKQDELSQVIDSDIRSLNERIETAGALAESLHKTAIALEEEGKASRKAVLAAALRSDQVGFFDEAFFAALKRTRKAAKTHIGTVVSDADINIVLHTLSNSLPSPSSISAVADAENALQTSRAGVERLDKILDTASSIEERHVQAFARELVTVYSALASDEAKSRAYSLSASLLDDFASDLHMIQSDLSMWFEARTSALKDIPEALRSPNGRLRIVRIFSGIFLIFLLLAIRHYVKSKISILLVRLARHQAFRGKAGTLVRVAVFWTALVPTLLTAIFGYALLALIGFDYPEIRILEVALRWTILYFVLRQIIYGLTQRERRGRPPLIEMQPSNALLLSKTYARLGLFLILMSAVHEWTTEWLGTGSLSMVVRLMSYVWLGGWTVWALFAWRKPLAVSCEQISPENSRRLVFSKWIGTHRVGVFATPILLAWRVPSALHKTMKKLLAEGGLLSYFRARTLRRISRRSQSEAPRPVSSDLPKPYICSFPLYPLQGEEGEVLLPRRASTTVAIGQVNRWQETKQDGSLVLIGEKGMGKTTFLALLEKEIVDIPVKRHTLKRKMRSAKMLIDNLGSAFGLEVPQNVDALAKFLNEGPEQVILLDEAHNVFLRIVDGFEPVDTLVNLVDLTSEKIFWVLVFNRYSWSFLTKADRRVLSFRKQHHLPSWSQAELQELVAARNRRSGITVEFDEVLLDDNTDSNDSFELINSAEGFFRLLYETSRGNPRTATFLWLRSLTRISDKRLRAGLIREESAELLSKIDGEMLFGLASMAQHENLSINELHQTLNISYEDAAQAVRYLLENGILEPKHSDPKRMTLSPRFYHQVLRVLRDRNLLYLEN